MWLTFFRPLRHCCCYTWGFQQHDEMIKEKRKKVHFSPHKWFTQQQHFQGSSEYDKLLLSLYILWNITARPATWGTFFSVFLFWVVRSSMNISIRAKKRTYFIWIAYIVCIFMRFLLLICIKKFFCSAETGKTLYEKLFMSSEYIGRSFFPTQADKCG